MRFFAGVIVTICIIHLVGRDGKGGRLRDAVNKAVAEFVGKRASHLQADDPRPGGAKRMENRKPETGNRETVQPVKRAVIARFAGFISGFPVSCFPFSSPRLRSRPTDAVSGALHAATIGSHDHGGVGGGGRLQAAAAQSPPVPTQREAVPRRHRRERKEAPPHTPRLERRGRRPARRDDRRVPDGVPDGCRRRDPGALHA